MNLKQAQLSELIVNQSLPYDLVDQNSNLIRERGYIFKATDEINKLSNTPIYWLQERKPESENSDLLIVSFNDMKLKVGDNLQFKLQSKTKSSIPCSKHTVKLIGFIPNQILLVSMPITDQLTGHPYLEGDKVQVSLFSGTSVFSFMVFIENIIKLPFKYLHLSFPKQIYGKTIRKSQRIKCEIEVIINGASTPAIITNLSTAGAEIVDRIDLGRDPGDTIELSFELEFDEKRIPLTLPSCIRNTNTILKDGNWVFIYGLEFINLQTDQVFLLRSYVNQEIVKRFDSIRNS